MKNWNYIEGAKTGNGILDIFKKDKVIKMKKDSGEIVHIHSDGESAEQKSEREQMLVRKHNSQKEAIEYYKNHGYKVGNEAIAYTPEQLKRASWTTWQYIISHPEKYDDKTIAEAKRLNSQKTGNDTPLEYARRKPRVINEDKTGAEEFFKQLSDDVKEREDKDDEEIKLVGNETYQHKLYPDKYVIIEGNNYKIVTDGKVEKSGKITDAVLYGINHTYKRVGNFKTGTSALKPGDRVQSYGVQGTVRKVEGENSDNIYGEPIIEVEWDNGTVKKVGEHYLRKIGNKVGNSKWELPDGSTATVEDDGTIKIKKPRDSSIYITKLWDKERAEKQLAQKGAKKVGNALNWDENLVGKFVWVKDKGQEWKVYVMQDKGDKVYIRDDDDGSQGWVSKTRITGKVGNASVGGGTYASDDGSKKAVVDITNLQSGSTRVVWIEDGRQTGSNEYRSLQSAIDACKRKGLKKVGNRVIEKESEMSQELKNLLKKAPEWIKEKIQYAFSHGFTIDEKDFINAIKKEVGNSASDDKFAYVMREFDEGKLKTPDGKVVTDPAQAKAIAYSESKKTENGLARARKAMNKGITMWKGNDSAYIKEDGTVSYLENNSFETDKDKFESQESAIKELSKQGYVKK